MAARLAASLTAGAALAALLAGCTSGPGSAPAEEGSPLERMFEQIWGMDVAPEERERLWQLQAAETQEYVATCMQKQGFEYVPNVGEGFVEVRPEDWRPDDRSWVSEYGYGIVKVPGGGDEHLASEPAVDPNADYLASLSESERAAYDDVLYGALQVDPGDWQSDDAGCFGWAQRQLGTAPTFDLWETAEWQALLEKTGELNRSVNEHPSIREVHDDWSACMADAGLVFERPADASEPIYEALDEYHASHSDPSSTDPELAAIAEREVELALADLDCRESTDFADRVRPIRYELEAAFVAEHQDEIDAVLLLLAE
ncbi:hypothetical protein [Salinibacterium sp. ZJ70]|uniref:hypothetical protein n=1 Tax=Salinibacterium sp. ZJ70 TaxID=2708084 RepID=UPI00141FED3A|nr:hypothetical protein [Salinibacterium sp. ZJ70]